MKPLSLLFNLLIFCCLNTKLSAATYYLLYDPGCIDRLAYAYPETRTGNEFITYSLRISPEEHFMFEVGPENQSIIQNTLPANLITCNAPERAGLNAAFLDAINSQVHQLVIVIAVDNGQYRLSTVKQAFRFIANPMEVAVASAEYRLTYRPNTNAATGDLSANDTRGRVFFHSSDIKGGYEVLTFRQTHQTADDYLDITVHPAVGTIEERGSQGGTVFMLKTINGLTLEAFLNKQTTPLKEAFTSKSGLVKEPSSYDVQTPIANKVPPLEIRTHTVSKGESLYGIARKYQVTIPELQAWNNLGSSSIIQPGMRLALAAKPEVASSVPEVYNQTLTPKSSGIITPPTPAWINAPGQVTVAQGETVASLALKYGFTEARFRYFNHLTADAVLRPGDMVLTSDCEPSTELPTSMDFVPRGEESPVTTPKSPFYQDPYWAEFTPTPTLDASSPSAAQSVVPSKPSYYGPVPGIYNENRPLTEPQGMLIAAPASLTVPAPYSDIPKGYDSGFQDKSGITKPATINTPRKIHEVRPGETLQDVSRRYGIPLETLRKLNNLATGETIIAFQRLFIN